MMMTAERSHSCLNNAKRCAAFSLLLASPSVPAIATARTLRLVPLGFSSRDPSFPAFFSKEGRNIRAQFDEAKGRGVTAADEDKKRRSTMSAVVYDATRLTEWLKVDAFIFRLVTPFPFARWHKVRWKITMAPLTLWLPYCFYHEVLLSCDIYSRVAYIYAVCATRFLFWCPGVFQESVFQKISCIRLCNSYFKIFWLHEFTWRLLGISLIIFKWIQYFVFNVVISLLMSISFFIMSSVFKANSQIVVYITSQQNNTSPFKDHSKFPFPWHDRTPRIQFPM